MNASGKAYVQLRSRILNGSLKSGSSLKERELCSQLNVSRTPVREALRRLSAEGLTEVRPGRSMIVANLDPGQIDEIFELGVMLESFLAEKAALNHLDQEVADLENTLNKMAQIADFETASNVELYLSLDQTFHAQLAVMARCEHIRRILKQSISLRLLHNVFDSYISLDFDTSRAQHRTIFEAVASRNGAWAKAAMNSHIRTGQSTNSRSEA